MDFYQDLYKVYLNSDRIIIDDNSKIIIMSDCHRGINTNKDNFKNVEPIFIESLKYYLSNEYTYIELGDGDELWENNDINKIIKAHYNSFKIMSKLYENNRFYMLYGNHDMSKKDINVLSKLEYYDNLPLFPNIKIRESLILKYDNNDILLIHGHQGDYINDKMWILGKFISKYVWSYLESFKTKLANEETYNNSDIGLTKQRFINWSIIYNKMIIAGHTHKISFPNIKEHMYFNDGSASYNNYITGIEIVNGSISLVKWSIIDNNIKKEILTSPVRLKKYFKQ